MATSLAPKPKKPPVLIWMLLTEPSGPVLTRCTVPTLLPSDEITAKRISGLASRGAVADLPVAPGWVAAGGAGPCSGRAAGGGALGEGGLGVGVCAVAGSHGAPARTTHAPTRRTSLRCDMARSPYHWTCPTTVLDGPGSRSLRTLPRTLRSQSMDYKYRRRSAQSFIRHSFADLVPNAWRCRRITCRNCEPDLRPAEPPKGLGGGGCGGEEGASPSRARGQIARL